MRFAPLRTLGSIAFGVGLAAPAMADLNAALATADPSSGERAFKRCAACHTVEKDGQQKVGPNLYGVVGGPVAGTDGFRYSTALADYAGNWSPERLDAFLAKPRAEVKSTRMSFAGVRNEADRVNLIAYLNTFSDTPIPFGAGDAATPTASEEDTYEFGLLVDAPGVEVTYYTCVACHSERIVAQQGLSREHWDEMLEWMVEEQGMSEIDEPDRTEILDYLAEHYNEDRPNFPSVSGN